MGLHSVPLLLMALTMMVSGRLYQSSDSSMSAPDETWAALGVTVPAEPFIHETGSAPSVV